MAGALLVAVGCAAVASQMTGHAQSAAGLTFFKNYFLTGDYAVAGVGLRGMGGQNGSPAGIATGTITIDGIRSEADVIAAFLYWQVVSKSSLGPDSGAIGATFDGNPLFDATATNAGPFSVVLNQAGTAPCWSSGGGTGNSGGNVLTYTYRADVRRFLKTDANDRIVASGQHVVQVPDSGSGGNGVPIALGASLVIVYRDPTKSFKSIVLYDGGLTLNNSSPTYDLTLKGFYQPATTWTDGPPQVTYVVGSGQLNKNENVYFNNNPTPLASNPFTGGGGNGSWDTDTFTVDPSLFPPPPSDPQYGAMVTTRIDTALTGGDCLTPAMIGYKTEVQDSDGDGLLDLWESTSGLLDPDDHPLPDLESMKADPYKRDLFVEVGYMKSDGDSRYSTTATAHTHLPSPGVLKQVGDSFANAPAPVRADGTPVLLPNGAPVPPGITVHFDVGTQPSTWDPNGLATKYLVPGAFARGGEFIDETQARDAACGTSADRYANCQFPDYPGTVGWKVGYKYYRDQLLNTPPPLNADGSDPCDVDGYLDGPGQACERRFDSNRKNVFHYVLAAHFVGLPKSEYPCLAADGTQVAANSDGSCSFQDNPLFHTPRTVSGISDFPGGDVMLTLGGFNAPNPANSTSPPPNPPLPSLPVGTDLQQAGTLMHELGHNFDFGHTGPYPYDSSAPAEANCNPNYLSVMNYLFQLRGLFGSTTAGGPQIDYSLGSFASIDESKPSAVAWNTAPYLTAWYAPQTGSSWVGSPVTRHCTGTVPAAGEPPMMRVDGPASGNITWDTTPQDINFDGIIGTLSAGHADWDKLRLNQLATRRNIFGMSVNLGRDGMGRGDGLGRDGMGRDGMGRDGMGRDGMGRDGMGRDGMGRDGMGRDGMGRDGMGTDGLGGGDGLGRDGLGHDWANRDVGELDAEVAAAAGHVDATPPTITFTASGTTGSGGWYVSSPVTVTVTATDPSRVALLSCNPSIGTVTGIGTTSASGQLALTATTAVSCTATDSVGNMTTATSGQLTINIDTTAPTISITTPANGGTYYLNQAVAASYGCADVSGSGIASCVGTVANGANIDTSTAGAKTFTVTAKDNAGNTATKTASYSVGYNVTLTPLKTPAKQGSAVPVIWQEKDGTGAVISDLSTVLELDGVYTGPAPSTGCVPSPTGIVPNQVLYKSPDFSTGKSTLRFVSPNFQFNWDTTSTTVAPYGAGCYTVLIYLSDRGMTNPRMTTAVLLK